MEKTYSFLENRDSVLERLGGNDALLDSLMVKFGDSYVNAVSQLESFVAAGQTEDAHRIVHSIKGVAGNLGMGRLYRSAISLESKMKSGEYRLDSEEALSFASELGSVIGEIGKRKGNQT